MCRDAALRHSLAHCVPTQLHVGAHGDTTRSACSDATCSARGMGSRSQYNFCILTGGDPLGYDTTSSVRAQHGLPHGPARARHGVCVVIQFCIATGAPATWRIFSTTRLPRGATWPTTRPRYDGPRATTQLPARGVCEA